MDLEFASDGKSQEEAGLIVPINGLPGQQFWRIDWRPAVAELVAARLDPDAGRYAARFHAALARSIADLAEHVGIKTVVLSGGCFQNVLLLEQAETALRTKGFDVLCHRRLPPNDGGLAAGQALGALWGITSVLG
jgi:hydrogenase maturation protein HypF